MQVTQEQLNPCEIELNIEVETEKVDAALESTYKELAKTANVPGFRKGKAPRAILERFLDEDRVKERAADIILQDAYKQALDETKIDPFAPADVEVVKFEAGEPFVFKAKVPLAPKVELGEYKGIDIERKVQKVSDEDIDGEITRMRERQSEFPEITDRGAEKGDLAVLEMKDETQPEAEMQRNVADVGENLPDFDAGLMGMKAGEEKVIDVSYPEDHPTEDLRGKTVPLRTKLVELRGKKLPELTDEWVKTTFVREEEGAEPGPDAVDTVDKLRGKVREAMEKAATDAAETEVNNKILKEIVDRSNICFPEVMVEERIHERLDEIMEDLKQRKLTIDDYLKHVGMTFEELHERLAEDARGMLKTSLVLQEIIQKEEIKVEDDDVKAEIQTMAEARGVPYEAIDAYLDKTDGKQSVRNRILQKKVMDFLAESSNIKNVGDKPAKKK